MANLTALEKRRFEKLFRLSNGYVFDFSNSTFAQFVEDSTGRDIYASKYDYGSGSKANRLRGFWTVEANYIVAKLLADLLAYGQEIKAFENDSASLIDQCQKAVARISKDQIVVEMDSLAPDEVEKDFEILSKEVREAIERNQPESGLDRLHTFTTKYVRDLCVRRGIKIDQAKALHSLFGEYVKQLKEQGHIESEMALRILKSSIGVLDAFNDVRNNKSLAHDNQLLNYEESLLIFNHIAASIRYIRALEAQLQPSVKAVNFWSEIENDIPF